MSSRKPQCYKEPVKELHPLVHRLRKRRYEIGLTARQIADKSGYETSQIQSWERGLHMPGLQSLTDWAQTLGVRIDIIED